MIERFHRFLKERLRCIAQDKQLDFTKTADWDIFIKEIEFAYNSTPKEMLKHAPYEIIYGDIIKTPHDIILSNNNKNIDKTVENTVDIINNDDNSILRLPETVKNYVKLLKEHQKVLKQEIIKNLEYYDKQRKKYYDKNRKQAIIYNIGDNVVVDIQVRKVGNAKKLNINRKPAIIIDKINKNAYAVRYENGVTEAVNIARLYKNNHNSILFDKNSNKNKKQRVY